VAVKTLFSDARLLDVHGDVLRNIVSIRSSQDLFDDLSDSPDAWALAQQVEDEVKPPPYQSKTPVIHRPFEDATWYSAIGWPFKHWQASRFSDGTFGVWYGAESVETTVYETVYHWFHGFLRDAGFEAMGGVAVIGERKVYDVRCDAALLDVRAAAKKHVELMHTSDYSAAQALGGRLHREGHPGLVIASVRRSGGFNYAVLNPDVLSNPRHHCQLTYRLEAGTVRVEKQVGRTWLKIDTATLA
jgi:hypothetical protein